MRNLNWVLLCILFLGVESYGEHLEGPLLENTENNNDDYELIVGHDRLMAYGNNEGYRSIDSEDEEVCDQKLVDITVNFGDKFYTLCLETDEDNRIKGLRYNTYREETYEFVKSKTYNRDDLGFHDDCTLSRLNEVSSEIPLADQGFQSLAGNDTDESPGEMSLVRYNDFVVEDSTNFNSCAFNQRINMGSIWVFDFLDLETSDFTVDQGGDLHFSYIAFPMDPSRARLDLRLFKYEDEWRLSDMNDQRVIVLDVELKRIWLFFKKVPVGIKEIYPVYEVDVAENN